MASATFDTLHAAKALTAAGFEAHQAEAITDTIREAFTESVATKADLAGLEAAMSTDIAKVKAELQAEIGAVKAELKADIAEVRTEIAEVRTEIAEVRTDMAERFEALYKQLWLMALGIVTAVAAIVKLL